MGLIPIHVEPLIIDKYLGKLTYGSGGYIRRGDLELESNTLRFLLAAHVACVCIFLLLFPSIHRTWTWWVKVADVT